MMHLQYIADKFGHTTAVQIQIPIEDWALLKKKYKELEEEENAADVPDWQIALGKEELNNIAAGSSEIMDWDASQQLFKM
jgi:hypothetical protein